MTKSLTIEERRLLRRKPFWRVADFARYLGLSHWQAKSILQRYDSELNGMLLRTSRGKNRLYGFYWAALAKHDSDVFIDDPLETLRRVDKLEEDVVSLDERQHGIGIQLTQNKRDIERLLRARKPAA